MIPKHYDKKCPKCGLSLDVYRISLIYGHSGPQHHLAKKALCIGERGHKDAREDLTDIIKTAQRMLELLNEDQAMLKESKP